MQENTTAKPDLSLEVARFSRATISDSPISRVPLEILQEIFMQHPCYVSAAILALWSPPDCRIDHESLACCWTATSHVCRRWRAAALSCPRLWSYLSVSSRPEWMAELLRRSGQVSLHIRLYPKRGDTDEDRKGREQSLELVLGQLQRIRELCCASRRSFPPQCVKMLAGPAPQLRRLALGGKLVRRPPSPAGQDQDDNHVFCPDVFYAGNIPWLEYLEFDWLFHGVRIREPFSSSLKHLKIRVNSKEMKYVWPSLDHLVDMLSALPSLEILDMWQDDRFHPVPPFGSRRVHLPRLHTIRLLWGALTVSKLLEQIDSPPPKLLDVAVHFMYRRGVMLACALQHTVGNVYSVQTLKISGFRYLPREQLRIQGDAISRRPDGPQEHLKFDIKLLDGQHVGEYTIWAICQHVLDFQTLSAFTLEMEDALYGDYLAILEMMYEVKTFTLCGRQVMMHLWHMIAPKSARFHQKHMRYIPLDDYNPERPEEDPEDYVDRWPSPFLLPALETIVLQGAVIVEDFRFKYETLDGYVVSFCSALRERASGGAAVKELCLKGCSNISETVLAALQGVMEETGGKLTIM